MDLKRYRVAADWNGISLMVEVVALSIEHACREAMGMMLARVGVMEAGAIEIVAASKLGLAE